MKAKDQNLVEKVTVREGTCPIFGPKRKGVAIGEARGVAIGRDTLLEAWDHAIEHWISSFN